MSDAATPRTNRGWFKRGADSRRHKFTADECSAGFWAAVQSIIERYPNAIMPDGCHMVVNFLKNRPTRQAIN